MVNIGVESKLDCCVASAEDSASPAGNEVTSPVWAAEFHAAPSADGKNELGPMPELLKPSATDASTSISRSSTVSVAAAITERPANSANTAHEYSAAEVRPKDGYDQIRWAPEAALIWGPDLHTDNTLLCRMTVNP